MLLPSLPKILSGWRLYSLAARLEGAVFRVTCGNPLRICITHLIRELSGRRAFVPTDLVFLPLEWYKDMGVNTVF